MPQSILGITKTMHDAVSQFTRGEKSLQHTHWDMFPQHFDVFANVVIFVPACQLSVPHTFFFAATCRCNMTPHVWPLEAFQKFVVDCSQPSSIFGMFLFDR